MLKANHFSSFGHKAVLFEPAIEHNSTEEQKVQWPTQASSGRILGSYAQTELGHGSFVRRLETTAIFDEKTDEFIIHPPNVSSTKSWATGLAFSTTNSVVTAQLVVNQKQLGPHLFIVQTRSMKNGKPMPGIKMG
jgi:acyl-CoA oxidase